MVLFETLLAWTIFVYIVEIITFKKTYSFVKAVRERTRKEHPKYNPFVSVIVPFKGIDYEMEENVKAILSQDYRKYEAIFVVDSLRDPAYGILRKFLGNRNVRILKQKPIKTCSGKVSALMAGVEKAGGEVLVFADSDIRPTGRWLKELVNPLVNKNTGVTTAYRFYFPVRNSFVSCLKSAWNTIGLGIMFSRYAFVWGGSFAMTRKMFDKLQIKSKWRTAISDDTVITESVRGAGLGIRFVPQSISASLDDTVWSGLKEWTSRQIFFVRHYDYRTWKYAFLIYGYFNLVLLTAIVSLLLGILETRFVITGILLLLPQLFTIIRNYFRDKTLEELLPEYKDYFDRHKHKRMLADIFVKPLVMYNLFKTRNMKTIKWRGREYRIK